MINQSEVNEIKEMIKEGISPKLISFELEIPLDIIKRIEDEVKAEENAPAKKTTELSKMEVLRKRYYELYSPKKDVSSERNKSNAQQTSITSGTKYNPNAPIKVKRRAIYKLVEEIELLIEKTEDIEELQALQKRITPEMQMIAPMAVDSLKNSITAKITSLQRKRALDRIKNNIPSSILEIIVSLVNNELDMQKANAIIDAEAKRRVASKPKTRFSLTEEQERGQILIQIQTAIAENPDKYSIKKPEAAVSQIQELCGSQKGVALRTVVINLIGRKHFETARIICNKFAVESKEVEMQAYIKRLLADIRNGEIADFVLKGIHMNGTVEEENAYFDLLQAGLRKGEINPRAISLGKSKNGLREITLADILYVEKQHSEKNK